jgi:hypothetical protein
MKIRTRIALGTTLTAAAVLGLGATTATAAPLGSAPASTEAASEVEDCHFGEHLVRLWLALPTELRADLRELKDLEPGERGPLARDIRDDAMEGEYGPGVQGRVERVHERRIRVWSTLPVELKDDLLDLRGLEPDERRAAAEAIAQDALAGGYGEKVQQVTERIQGSEFWQSCVER